MGIKKETATSLNPKDSTLPHAHTRKRPILTYPLGKAPSESFPLKVFKIRT